MAKVQQTPLKHDVAIENKQAETMVRVPIHIIYIFSYLVCIYVCVCIYMFIYMFKYMYTHSDGGLQTSKMCFLIWDFRYMALIPS